MRKLYSSLTLLITYLFFTPVAFAQQTVSTCPGGTFNILCSNTSLDFGKIVQTVITLLLLAAVIIALVFLILGGIKWILSGGDKTAVESARNHIVGAIVGLVIAFAAYIIITIVFKIFGLGSPTNLTLPSFFGQ